MSSLRPPLSMIYGNCVFGAGLDDAWAAFAVPTASYDWLTEDGKRTRFLALLGALEAAAADLQIVRVAREWDVDAYVREMDSRDAPHREIRQRYIAEQARRLREHAPQRAALFVLVSLREPERDVASYVSRAAESHPREWLRALRRAVAPYDRRLLRARDLEQIRVRADRAQARLADFLHARPASGAELQWLVRRAFCRGLGEPVVDGLHEPRALLFERNGEAVLAPLEGDVLRWMDGWVEHRGRALRIESELGVSWQTQLVVGALPERADFPGPRVELMFAPVESLPFGVDLSLNARFLPNELALRIARRRIQDADQILRAESDGDQGASDLGFRRTQEARDLLSYLQSSSRPPLLRGTLALALAAPDEQELERRVELCRRAYGEIRLHRPLGDQLQLFCQHLPAQRTRVAGYDDTLTTEQVAAMMPTASHQVGSETGFYLGHTLSASARPVRLHLREGSESNRNTTILSVGALGSGKTTLDQKLKYEGFLLGARIVDCDPKGDHRFHLLEQVAPHVETITLRPDAELRGVLDPLRVAPSHLRQDTAVSFLRDLLPGRAEPAWETAVVGAVDRVLRRTRDPTCLEVVHALHDGDEIDAQVAKTLAVYARSGLTQLGFADPAVKLAPVGGQQVTYLRIRDLPSAQPGVPRSEHSQSERVGEQLVRLIAMFALHLMGAERERLKLFSFKDEKLVTRRIRWLCQAFGLSAPSRPRIGRLVRQHRRRHGWTCWQCRAASAQRRPPERAASVPPPRAAVSGGEVPSRTAVPELGAPSRVRVVCSSAASSRLHASSRCSRNSCMSVTRAHACAASHGGGPNASSAPLSWAWDCSTIAPSSATRWRRRSSASARGAPGGALQPSASRSAHAAFRSRTLAAKRSGSASRSRRFTRPPSASPVIPIVRYAPLRSGSTSCPGIMIVLIAPPS